MRQKLYAAHPQMARIDDIAEGPAADLSRLAEASLGHELFKSPIIDFFLTNPIARSSRVMVEASALAKSQGHPGQGQMLQAAE